MSVDLSKLEHVEERRKMLELSKRREAIDEAEWEAVRSARDRLAAETARLNKEAAQVRKPLEEAIEQARELFDKQRAEIDKEANALGAEFSYEHSDYSDYSDLDVGALSGLPILEDEPVLTDEKTGGVVIRALVPLPETQAPSGSDQGEAA